MRDVRGELNKIVSPVDVILRKLAERQVKLQNALLRSQEFQVQTVRSHSHVFISYSRSFSLYLYNAHGWLMIALHLTQQNVLLDRVAALFSFAKFVRSFLNL